MKPKKRLGAVIVFKEGVSEALANKILIALTDGNMDQETVSRVLSTHEVGVLDPLYRDRCREFDENIGSPVWYIP